MKILYHHRTASKDGQAVHIEEMISALRALGHEVRVVAPGGHDDPDPAADMGAEVGWVQRLRQNLPKFAYEILELAYSLVAYQRLARAAREFKPDLIYERYNLFLLSGLMLKKRTGLPLLLEVNAPLVQERGKFGGLALPRLARWAEGVVWRGADFVLPVTQVLGQHVTARGVPAERLAIIPNGINEAHFATAPKPDEAKASLGWSGALVLGFTGFVRDWHGMDHVIRWMATSDAPANARLLIVGDGPARADLEQLARDLALGERVRFTGVVARDEVPNYVAAFDVALQPAVVPYASPLKLFEYLALAKAVVAPMQPNIAEILEHDLNALLFDPARPGALEQALTRLCADNALRERLGQGAHATIARMDLTWLGNARRVVALAKRLGAQADAPVAARSEPGRP
jgi:glycosyltransferase involved in cell wall biosynthesis